MQPAKSYELKWNNCEQIFSYNFKQFLHEAKYTDCIIAAEGKFIKAHRLVLAAASAYFDKMFEIGKQEPMIVLSDVLYEDLLGIIEFVYTGHVSIPSDNYHRFMKSARCLQLKGVSDQDDDPDDDLDATPLTPAAHSDENSSRFSVEPPIFDMNEGTSNEATSLLVKEESLSNTPIITEEPRMGRSRGRKRLASELGEPSVFSSPSSQFLKILLSPVEDSRLKAENGEVPNAETLPVIRREKKKSIHWRKRATNMDPLNTSHLSCVCRFCENRYSRHSIPSHERNCKMNPNRRVHQCTICMKVLSRADKLNDHMKIHLRKSM